MNIAQYWLEHRVVTLVLTFVMLGAGLMSYQQLSRLEDPEFTIKEALVITQYPGASAYEVEQEVTDEIELAIQQLGQLKRLDSKSDRGLSTITVVIQDRYDKESLPQVWDELRRKVGDAQKNLPPGARPSLVLDDYGDVFGVFVTISGEEYSYAELKQVTDLLRRELLLVQDVAKIETFGERVESVYIEPDRIRVAQLGISPWAIARELQTKNVVVDAGHVQIGPEFVAIEPTGGVDTVSEIGDILIRGSGGKQIRIHDFAGVSRGYIEPASHLIRYDGAEAIGLGISTISGGNVVVMGRALSDRLQELQAEIPLGIDIGIVSLQSETVVIAIDNFVNSLVQAVIIVIVVLLFFMGLRSGLIIGFILLVTIIGSLIFLGPMEVALERISLGALIIALGMLVDNAIVVIDGMLVRIQAGRDPEESAIEVVKQTAIPLLGATVIAVLAFAAIGTSEDKTGEFCRSLFQVVMISLMLSWVTAVTITPLLGVLFLKRPEGDAPADPFDSGFYRMYKNFLGQAIRMRYVSLAVVVGLFFVAVYGFRFVNQTFFPPSTRPQFMIDVWMPQGSIIDETVVAVEGMETVIQGRPEVTHVTSVIGRGALRFLLTYTPEKSNPAYAQFLVDVESTDGIDDLILSMEQELTEAFPDAQIYGSKFQLGPGATGKIRARFSGPDPDVLRRLAENTLAIYRADPDAKAIRTDWRDRVKLIRPLIAEIQANAIGVTRENVADVLRVGSEGYAVGQYRDNDLLLPIIYRSAERERRSVDGLESMQIWGSVFDGMLPLSQVISKFETDWEDEMIYRRNRKRTIIAFADPIVGEATSLFARIRPQVEALELPRGYVLEWGGDFEDSNDARQALAGGLPVFILLMILVTIGLFNSLKQPAIIWLCVPLALIGVTGGLLGAGQPFGFMALLGFLSLVGMLIKNAIVLIDEMNTQSESGKPLFDVVVDSATSRLRPVAMAAATTALGMIPLLFDAFFVSMAVTIIAGLLFATVLTMVVVPVLYATFYGAGRADS